MSLRRIDELHRQIARLRDKVQRLRQLHGNRTLPLNLRLWVYSLNEDMGATTAHQADADLYWLSHSNRVIKNVTVTDVLQCLGSAEQGAYGICAEQINIDGTLFYVPICCRTGGCECDDCDPTTVSCSLQVDISGIGDNTCSNCEELDGTYVLDQNTDPLVYPCQWEYEGLHNCATGSYYGSPGVFRIIARVKYSTALSKYYWEVMFFLDQTSTPDIQDEIYRWWPDDENTKFDCTVARTLDQAGALVDDNCTWPSTIDLTPL